MAPGLVTLVERYARKGKRIMVMGQLETRKWQDQSGQDRYSTEVVLRPFKGEVEIIDWPEQDGGGSSGDGYSGGSSDNSGGSGYGDNQQGGGQGSDLDDEIPF